jgi:hypothetical protein
MTKFEKNLSPQVLTAKHSSPSMTLPSKQMISCAEAEGALTIPTTAVMPMVARPDS